jgi:DNA-binding protein
MDFIGFEPLQQTTVAAVSAATSSSTFPRCQEDGQINVRQSGKIRNYVRYATKHLNTTQVIPIVLQGTGTTISMAITIAEILKRTFVDVTSGAALLHQRNSIGTCTTTTTTTLTAPATTPPPCRLTIYLGWTKEAVMHTGPNQTHSTVLAQHEEPGYQSPTDAAAGCEFFYYNNA